MGSKGNDTKLSFFADMQAIYSRDDLSATEKHLAIVVLSFRNRDDGTCNPPVASKTLSKKTGKLTESLCSRSGLSDRAVQNNLDSLEAKGIFVREKHKQAPADFTFTLTPNDVHPEAGSPRTTFTPTPNVVHPHPEAGSPSPRTSFPQTDKEQIRNSKGTVSSLSPSDKKAPERPQADVPCNGSRQVSIDESLNLEADLFAEHEKGSDLHAMQSEAPSAMSAPTDAQNAHSAQIEGVGGRFSMPKSKYPACPYEKIVALYHEICPTLPRIAVINDSRKRSIKSRWLELCKEENYSTEDEGLEGMKVFFQIVKNSRFLTGRVDPSPGRNRPFIADLDFLMRPTKFIAVFEGKYDGTRPQVIR